MKKFEYNTGTLIYKNLKDLQNQLNNLGEDGWEIIELNKTKELIWDGNKETEAEYIAKRQKIESKNDNVVKNCKDFWMIVDSYGSETWLDTNEIYVNIGTCAGDEWIESLWKKVLVEHIDADGILAKDYPNRKFKSYIPLNVFKPNNLVYSLDNICTIKKI